MLIYFRPATKSIYGINDDLTKEDALEYVTTGCVWVESEEVPILTEGQEWYLTGDNQIGVRETVEPVTPEPSPDPVMKKLDSIEAKIQTNEELQTFYDDIVKEVGL